jgi:hypothetical protein
MPSRWKSSLDSPVIRYSFRWPIAGHLKVESFCGTGVWTQGFMLAKYGLKPHLQSIFTQGSCYSWTWTVIFLNSAFQVARITGVSSWRQAETSCFWNHKWGLASPLFKTLQGLPMKSQRPSQASRAWQEVTYLCPSLLSSYTGLLAVPVCMLLPQALCTCYSLSLKCSSSG